MSFIGDSDCMLGELFCSYLCQHLQSTFLFFFFGLKDSFFLLTSKKLFCKKIAVENQGRIHKVREHYPSQLG